MVNKMKYNKRLFFISTYLILSTTTTVVNAAHNDLVLNVNPIEYNRPVNAVIQGDLVTGNWNSDVAQSSFCYGLPTTIDKETVSPLNGFTGSKTIFDGVSYDIFPTSNPNIGWIMSAKDGGSAGTWSPILSGQETQVFPVPGGVPSYPAPGAKIRFALVKLPGTSPDGLINLIPQDLAKVRCYYQGKLSETATISMSAISMTFKVTSCQVQTGSQTLQMGTYTRQRFSSMTVGDNIEPGNTVNISLNCNKNVTPFVTISDNNNLNNESNIISLTAPNATTTAQGVGYQAFFKDNVQSLGPKSANKGNKGQFQINPPTTTDNQLVPMALQFKYVKTGNTVKAGDANAAVTLTFSYQ